MKSEAVPRDASRGIPSKTPAGTLAQRLWRRLCLAMSRIFYRRFEVAGLDHLPATGPVILCANHVNALVDAVVVQAACRRTIHPLARSGLFRSFFFRPILRLIQAVPVYRRHPQAEGLSAQRQGGNRDAFERCYELLAEGRAILIFPEGQSHSDPRLRDLKTGAARLALGSLEHGGGWPAVVPVGLTFTNKGRFRSKVLVQIGPPVEFERRADEAPEAAVRRLTAKIGEALERVTLNVDSWEDLSLLQLLQDFFTLRSSRRPSLDERFRSLQQLIDVHRRLRYEQPDAVAVLREKLRRFARLCRRYGVRNYQLELRYRPALVARFVLRALVFALLIFPLAAWGLANSLLPYLATRAAIRLTAKGRDQYDTAGMIFGLFFFLLFWSAQTAAATWWLGSRPAIVYGLSLPLTGAIALAVAAERKRITENVRIFLLFLRKSELRDYLQIKRQELEVEVARLARRARQLDTARTS